LTRGGAHGVTRPTIALNQLSADKRRVDGFHGLLALGQINHDGYLDFAGGDHVNVDAFVGERLK